MPYIICKLRLMKYTKGMKIDKEWEFLLVKGVGSILMDWLKAWVKELKMA